MRGDASTFILPVENQVRELDAKLLFACVAAERGFPVVLGSRTYLNFAMPFLRRGVFFAKSMRARSVLTFNLMRDLGHTIVAWDEESLVRFNSPEYCGWRFSEATFSPLDQLFAWGKDDAEMFAEYPGNGGTPVHITGNPRVDLLRGDLRDYFARDVADLRNQYGDFILLNTNFAFVNAFVRRLNLVSVAADGDQTAINRTGEGLSVAFARGMFDHQQAIFEGFRRLMPVLSARFPNHSIVLRPHPSEDHDLWRRLTADLDNIHVVHEGNVVPWLMACRVLIHNGCTTAVEAAVVETPAITYQPVTAECFDYDLPNSLSHQALTPADVCELAARILEGQLGLVDEAKRRAIFDRHLSSTTGALACDRIVDVLEHCGYRERIPPWPGIGRYARGWIAMNGRTLVKHINMLRAGHWNSAAYHAHRFPKIGVDELERRINRFREQLGRFEHIRASQMSSFLFRISSPQHDKKFVGVKRSRIFTPATESIVE